MTRRQLLLIQLNEELAEAQHAACKALRFGLDDVSPKTGISNLEYLTAEISDIVSVLTKLEEDGVDFDLNDEQHEAKLKRIEEYLDYSRQKGILDE